MDVKSLAPALGVITRLVPSRIAACLELACALQVWFALHGRRTEICLGKRIEKGRLLLHAWIEPDGVGRDERFEIIGKTCVG